MKAYDLKRKVLQLASIIAPDLLVMGKHQHLVIVIICSYGLIQLACLHTHLGIGTSR